MLRGWGDFPGKSVVKNLPCNAGDSGLSPGQGTKIPNAREQPSPHTTTRDSVRHDKRFPHDPTKILRATTKTPHNQINQYILVPRGNFHELEILPSAGELETLSNPPGY